MSKFRKNVYETLFPTPEQEKFAKMTFEQKMAYASEMETINVRGGVHVERIRLTPPC